MKMLSFVLMLYGLSSLMSIFNIEFNALTVICVLIISSHSFFWAHEQTIKGKRERQCFWSIFASSTTFSILYLLINLWPELVNWKFILPISIFSSIPAVLICGVTLLESMSNKKTKVE